MRYNNYHSHKIYSNIRSLDVITKPKQYLDRMRELGHNIYFTTEHGYQGNVYEAYTLCNSKEYKDLNIKLVVGAEFYYVKSIEEKDRGNYHLIIIALNDNGYKQINKALSIANTSGYYYKPRIDENILYSVFNPNDVIVTTACTAGILSMADYEEQIIKMKNFFKDNLYLEVQNHNHINQKKHNEKVLNLSEKYGINIIHANDSHYIYPYEAEYRTKFLKAKGISYPEESGYILDYPDSDTIINRYKEQGILSDDQILQALNNTLVFDRCEELTVINHDIKLPSISNNPKQELRDIVSKEWNELKKEIKTEKHKEYEDAIEYELDIIEKTHMEDYFILDYYIVKKATEDYDGLLTKTGRGSAPSFIITKLLGLTEIDRIDSPVPLFPTRFMSTERILGTKSLPDIDLNSENPEPFIQATKDLLGEENCAWMLSYKPMQDASAFRLWCKANDMKISEYDNVAKNLDKFRDNKYWGKIIEDSKVFIGVVESISPSPCSMLLYNKPLDEEIGIIKTKDGYCCNIDGYNCDVYKYLKNDYLTVKVWEIIRETCKLANIKIPSISELNNLLDKKTFDIYKNKLTCTINQADSDFATKLASDYGISSLAETSAFVAAIRPGFKSLLDNFIQRKPYTTGVKELDELLSDSYHYMMYQESIMKYLIWLGIKESESYDIIKKIAKKKFKDTELKELHEKLLKGWINKVGNADKFEETWQVVEDAAAYSFNASHSLSYAYDSLYGAYLKSHYPLEYYSVAFNLYDGDIDRTTKLVNELNYFGISLKQPKFRYSKSKYFMDKVTNSIYKGIGSIKFLNNDVADYLYELREKKYNTFTELLIDLQGHINSRQLEILIKLNFFEEFGKTYKLLSTVEAFNKLYNKKQFKVDNTYVKYIRLFAKTQTDKTLKDVDTKELCEYIENRIENNDLPVEELIQSHYEFVGNCTLTDEDANPRHCVAIKIDTKYTPKVTFYNIKSGRIKECKISKNVFKDNPFELYDLVYLEHTESKPKRKLLDGKWVATSECEMYVNSYWKVLE